MLHRAMTIVLFTAAVAWSQPVDGGVLDAPVETSDGSKTSLRTLWSKPTVLFYEDRDSTALNQHVKDELFARGKSQQMLDRVSVVAVANVAAYDWFPARPFVLSAVRDAEKKVNVTIYLDFKGTLQSAPWSLPSKTSTVLVLDSAGTPVWRAQGRLGKEKIDELFTQLERLTH